MAFLWMGFSGNLTLSAETLRFSVPSSLLCVMSKKLMFCCGIVSA